MHPAVDETCHDGNPWHSVFPRATNIANKDCHSADGTGAPGSRLAKGGRRARKSWTKDNAGRRLDRNSASNTPLRKIQYRLFTFRRTCLEPSDMVAVVIVSHRRRKYCIEATWEGVLAAFAPRLGDTET